MRLHIFPSQSSRPAAGGMFGPMAAKGDGDADSDISLVAAQQVLREDWLPEEDTAAWLDQVCPPPPRAHARCVRHTVGTIQRGPPPATRRRVAAPRSADAHTRAGGRAQVRLSACRVGRPTCLYITASL